MLTLGRLKIVWLYAVLLASVGCSDGSGWKHYRGGTQLTLEVSKGGASLNHHGLSEKIAVIVEKRLAASGIEHRLISVAENAEILVQVPPQPQLNRLIKILTSPGRLALRIAEEVDDKNGAMDNKYNHCCDKLLIEQSGFMVYVQREPLVTNKHIQHVEPQIDANTQSPYILVTFTAEGGRLMEAITGRHIGKELAVVLEDKLFSLPKIRQRISGGVIALSGFDKVENAADLSILLNGGPYPAEVKLVASEPLRKELWLDR